MSPWSDEAVFDLRHQPKIHDAKVKPVRLRDLLDQDGLADVRIDLSVHHGRLDFRAIIEELQPRSCEQIVS